MQKTLIEMVHAGPNARTTHHQPNKKSDRKAA
jgi:hypothetical protein